MPRLNYGESVPAYSLSGFNKTEVVLEGEYKISLLSGDRLVELIDHDEVDIEPHSHMQLGESHQLQATTELFPEPGEYRIKATLMDRSEKKKTIHEITRKVWIEQDPNLNAPFDIEPWPFASLEESGITSAKAEWYLSNEGSGRFKLYYNIDHPTYLASEANDVAQARYLAEMFAAAALELLVRRIKADGEEVELNREKLPIDVEIILSNDPEAIYKEVMTAMGKIKYDIDVES
jgi:hypothetical protein